MNRIFKCQKSIILLAVAAGILAIPMVGFAQVNVTVGVPVPSFELQVGSPLVYVSPGVWVLPESEDEVFYNGGWYWARHGNHWYRTHGRQGGWVVIDDGYVPRPVVRMTGRYRNWRAPERARTMSPRGWEERGERGEKRGHGHDREREMSRGPGRQPEVRMMQPQMMAPQMMAPVRRGGDGRGEMRGGGRGENMRGEGGEGRGHGGGHGGGDQGGGHGGGHGRGH